MEGHNKLYSYNVRIYVMPYFSTGVFHQQYRNYMRKNGADEEDSLLITILQHLETNTDKLKKLS
jgi:hypothetical protein